MLEFRWWNGRRDTASIRAKLAHGFGNHEMLPLQQEYALISIVLMKVKAI